MHRAQFFEAVDTIRSTVDWRLDKVSLQPATCLQRVLTNAASNGIINGALLSSVEQFHPHLNLSQLKSELSFISQRHIEPSISGMVAWFRENDLRRATHKTVYDALSTFLVLPATTATCERSFSGLRRLEDVHEINNGSGADELIDAVSVSHGDIGPHRRKAHRAEVCVSK